MRHNLSFHPIIVFPNNWKLFPVINHQRGMHMSNLAFEIGFDHYLFKLPLDITRFSDEHRQQIRYGYEAAKQQRVSQRMPDLYESKLISLRDRALIKGFEMTLTPEDLRTKLIKTGNRCPITGETFTYARQELSDWSVDRIDNNLGYSISNIEIVSVAANQAKDDLDLAGIIKKAIGKPDRDSLLTEHEWFKMARFYYQKMKIEKPLSTCKILTDKQAFYDHIVFMQLFKNDQKPNKAFLLLLQKYCTKEVVNKASKLTQKRVYHRADIDVGVLYNSPKLYAWVRSFIKSINAHSAEFDPLLLDCLFA